MYSGQGSFKPLQDKHFHFFKNDFDYSFWLIKSPTHPQPLPWMKNPLTSEEFLLYRNINLEKGLIN